MSIESDQHLIEKAMGVIEAHIESMLADSRARMEDRFGGDQYEKGRADALSDVLDLVARHRHHKP
jgi:hypothetical protein